MKELELYVEIIKGSLESSWKFGRYSKYGSKNYSFYNYIQGNLKTEIYIKVKDNIFDLK